MTSRRSAHRLRSCRRGTILIVTMLIVFSVAAMVVVFCRSMRVEAIASANLSASLQASAVERGAEQYVIALLTEQKDALADITEDYFAAIPVGSVQGLNGAQAAGYFWIVRPDYGDIDLPLYGLTEEAAKLNINSAGYESLMRLPNMTDDVANAIMDWRDTDTNPQPGGAENEYYLGLAEPYTAKNDLFETVEELLMVRGITREALYGNGAGVPLGQQSGFRQQNSRDQSELQLARGWYDLLTVYSSEAGGAAAAPTSANPPPTQNAATTKINVNQASQRTRVQQMLSEQLGEARYTAVRGKLIQGAQYQGPLDFCKTLELKSDEVDKVFNLITAPTTSTAPAAPGASTASQPVRGRINVNTAPRDVLMTLPGLETTDVDKLISQRQGSTVAADKSISWVLEAITDAQKIKALGDTVTITSNQYSADIVAASGNGRSYKRVRIVVDASGTTPQIIYRREITDRGWPLDPQILDSLRAGQGPGGGAVGMGAGRGAMPGGTLR